MFGNVIYFNLYAEFSHNTVWEKKEKKCIALSHTERKYML